MVLKGDNYPLFICYNYIRGGFMEKKCSCKKTCKCGCQEGKKCTCKDCKCGCHEGKKCTCKGKK